MAIGNAVQEGLRVKIYNEKGQLTASVPARGKRAEDGLKGYTSTRVNIREGRLIRSYDEKGHHVGSVPAR